MHSLVKYWLFSIIIIIIKNNMPPDLCWNPIEIPTHLEKNFNDTHEINYTDVSKVKKKKLSNSL